MDALPTNARELRDLFDDLPTSMQDFYCGMFEQMGISSGDDYTSELAESLHRKRENLLALLVVERVWPNEDDLIDQVGISENMLTKLESAIHNYNGARRLAERAQEKLVKLATHGQPCQRHKITSAQSR